MNISKILADVQFINSKKSLGQVKFNFRWVSSSILDGCLSSIYFRLFFPRNFVLPILGWGILLIFFKINFFRKIISRTPSECRTVWIWVKNCLQRLSEDKQAGPEVIKLFPRSTQLSTKFQLLINTKILKWRKFLLCLSDVAYIMLINVKMPTIVGILTSMSRINFVLSWVEHEKSFITSGPGKGWCWLVLYHNQIQTLISPMIRGLWRC